MEKEINKLIEKYKELSEWSKEKMIDKYIGEYNQALNHGISDAYSFVISDLEALLLNKESD